MGKIKPALILAAIASAAFAGSEVPPPRLARALPPQASEAHARRARHNDALRQLFAETGIPTGSTASSIALRTSALELINMAITNRIELDGAGVTADAVAYAAYDFIGRYVLGQTNDLSHAPAVDAEGISRARLAAESMETRLFGLPGVLIVGDSHAANRLPHSGTDAWICADILEVPAANRLAVSGSTAAQWAADRDGWLTASANNDAPVVWISLGGNDAAAIAADGRADPPELRAAASNYLHTVRALARGRRLVIATAYADPWQGARKDCAAGVLRLNSAVRLLTARACNSLGVPFRVLEEPEILGANDYDGSGDLHPGAAGYTNMALRLQAIIREGVQK